MMLGAAVLVAGLALITDAAFTVAMKMLSRRGGAR